jgi:hypothetical protein
VFYAILFFIQQGQGNPNKEKNTKTTMTTNKNGFKKQETRQELLQPFLETVQNCGSNALLVRLYCYIQERIAHLHRFCVICDCPHINFLGGSAGNSI